MRPVVLSLKILGVLLALPVIAYLLLLFHNRDDQPPSPIVREFAASIANRPVVPLDKNAHALMLGFLAPPDSDARAIGMQRFRWIQRATSSEPFDLSADPLTDELVLSSTRSKSIREFAQLCGRRSPDCITSAGAHRGTVSEWLASESWLINRYRQLIAMSQHAGPVPMDLVAPFPSYSAILDGQRLYMLTLWTSNEDENLAATLAALDDDLTFWRMVQRNSDLLITKMIAVAAIHNHFVLGNAILREPQMRGRATDIPGTWRQPFTDDERSMQRTFVGEWQFVDHALHTLVTNDRASAPALYAEPGSLPEQVANQTMLPLLKPQDSSNQHAKMLAETVRAFDAAYSELPGAYERSKNHETDRPGFWQRLYNPVGNIVSFVDYGQFASYAARVADLEGSRRAAVLASELRIRRVSPIDADKVIRESSLSNPYTGEPLRWDEETRQIQFQGLEEGERGLYQFQM